MILVTKYELLRAGYSNGFFLGVHVWSFPVACLNIAVSTSSCLYSNVENSLLNRADYGETVSDPKFIV